MRRDRRHHAECAQQLAHRVGWHAELLPLGDHLRERPGERLEAALALHALPRVHRIVQLGDRENLREQADRLERARDRLAASCRRRAGRRRAPPPTPGARSSTTWRSISTSSRSAPDSGVGSSIAVGPERNRRRCAEVRARCHGHQATRSRGAVPPKNASRLSIARIPIATRVSVVALPRCGSSTTFSMLVSSAGTIGSFSNTSSPAPLMRPGAQRGDRDRSRSPRRRARC